MRALLFSCFAFAFFSFSTHAQTPSPDNVETISPPPLWQVCNESSYILRMAAAVKENGSLSAQGWQRLRPGACVDMDASTTSPRYVYAESSDAYQGGIREWAGKDAFCAGEENFEIKSAEECEAAGYEERQYRAVAADEYVTRFVEPDNFSRRAETAGMQRLLMENGYRVSRIDGVAGRRTARTLAAFIKDNKLAANLTTAQKIDALEKGASDRIKSLGVKVCNRSSNRIWAAVGLRLASDWETRGWWSVDAGDCVHPVTTALIGSSAHIFARQEQPGGEDGTPALDKYLRAETAEPSQFCIASAKFTARGRDNCRSNGYEPVSFRPLPEDKDGVTVNLSDSDFADQSRAGLRR